MKYNCSDEFDLELIYKKLTATPRSITTIKACDFFSRSNELELLQRRFEELERVKTYAIINK